MAASSSSFDDDSQIKHDVFISFRGEDVRRGFLSHLMKELDRKKIIAYVDDKLNRGEEIAPSLMRAIQESQISIVIFSQNYASSRWCLDELEEIIDSMKTNKQSVLPVFYYTDPSHVRRQKGAYQDAFADHRLKFQVDKKKLQNWRSALKDAAGLSGFVATNYNDDSDLIEDIVKDVLLRLKDIYPSEPKGLVGINQHINRIKSFLEKESKEVQILGIWGMSGIGKTTIAQAAYDKFSSNYEGSCFLDNVREETQKHGIKSLRQKLISELQEEKSNFPQKGFISRRKVLVVLDDVRTAGQLQYLLTEGIRLGPGSRVIVTSQNKKALIVGGVHNIHEVKELDFEESLKLFSLNAFKNSQPEKGYEELSKRAVGYAKGLPLALKVLGLCLYSEDKETWKSTMKKLELYPHHEIQDVLKMSFEGLDGAERDVFLDIAFFYKGEDKDQVMRLLDANNLFAACGIKGLLDKALISISTDNIIQMHDLIQEMGWEMVRQECKENPGKRSRLKDFEEVYDVLKNNKGTNAIQGIVLYASLFKDVKLNVDAFKSMLNLRVVKFNSLWHVRFCNLHLPTSFKPFSDELRRLKMDGCPSKSLPLISYPEKLVEKSMPNSHVKILQKLVQDFANSKRISPGRSKRPMELLDFTKAQKTEWGDICCCQGFCHANSYILSHSMIAALNLVRSKDSETLHSDSNLRSLRNFDVGLCSSVTLFSSSSSKETSELDLVTSIIEILYSSTGGVSELRRIMHGDSRLEILPLNELSCLRSFQQLHLSDSRQMNQTPELHILFDSLLYLQQQCMAICSAFLKPLGRIGAPNTLAMYRHRIDSPLKLNIFQFYNLCLLTDKLDREFSKFTLGK